MTPSIEISNLPAQPSTLDLAAVKAKQKATWASGDFAVIGTTLQIVGETLCEVANVCAGENVLDVACGNGNAALAAARRWAHTTGVDYVPELLAKGRGRAQADGLTVDFVEGDAEALPFANGAFDVVLSTYGCMFAPNQVKTAAELLRVTRPGGRIGLANWTPEGFIGKLFGIVGRYVPPPAGLSSPALWGRRAHVAALFGNEVSELRTTLREYNFRYESPAHFIQIFRQFYGPTLKAFGALDESGQKALAADIETLLREHNHGGSQSLVVPGEYLEVVATRR